jgi:hypothetical protein
MNFLATLPPAKRFFAALVCLPLMYLIVACMVTSMEAAQASSLQILFIGGMGIAATWKVQNIAAWIVTVFEKAWRGY